MTQRDPDIRLRHMLDHGQETLDLIRFVDQPAFNGDRTLQLAIVRLLEVVGEAAARTPDSVKSQHPRIPWRRISGLRSRLIHGYDTVDLEIVWTVLQNDLPPLVRDLDMILSQTHETDPPVED